MKNDLVTDLLKHYKSVFAAELSRIRMKDKIGYAFSGPDYVPHPQGQGLVLGWHAMLTLAHNILIGQPDVGVHIPVIGMTPPDEIIQKAAQFLLDNAREERFKMSNAVESGSGLPEGNVPRQANGDPLPPGLLPKGLEGQASQRRVQQSPKNGGVPAGFKATAVGHKAELPAKEKAEPEVTESDSGSFKIVDRRRRKR